jgi:predicted AlkP superfamily pyrophosphatase or phosphodiesterase
MKGILAASILFGWSLGAMATPAPRKPKLIAAVVVDQFRYDHLLRFHDGYTSGLKKMLDQGAVFDSVHLLHYSTVTAIGHATFLSGATPSPSGIVANQWYETGKTGHYYENAAVNRIAPTLAAIARVEEPDGSIGRVLQEMWQ